MVYNDNDDEDDNDDDEDDDDDDDDTHLSWIVVRFGMTLKSNVT